jgi:hypothetical protein
LPRLPQAWHQWDSPSVPRQITPSGGYRFDWRKPRRCPSFVSASSYNVKSPFFLVQPRGATRKSSHGASVGSIGLRGWYHLPWTVGCTYGGRLRMFPSIGEFLNKNTTSTFPFSRGPNPYEVTRIIEIPRFMRSLEECMPLHLNLIQVRGSVYMLIEGLFVS